MLTVRVRLSQGPGRPKVRLCFTWVAPPRRDNSSPALVWSVAELVHILISCSQDRGICTIRLRTQDQTNRVVTDIRRYCSYLFLVRTEVCKCMCVKTWQKSQGNILDWFQFDLTLHNSFQWIIIISTIRVKLHCCDIPFLLILTHHWWWLLTHMHVHSQWNKLALTVLYNKVW